VLPIWDFGTTKLVEGALCSTSFVAWLMKSISVVSASVQFGVVQVTMAPTRALLMLKAGAWSVVGPSTIADV
jgi:hypothetical protein